ncbi:M23 family metallopeptidase [Halalkalibacter akibai]|uniref:M23ase beta-sheet core domain-containing protein n=1 Tax=Halalkalibacter akibai (strain ATCC 43226 / DSM 21942 / CIP 109018 / JCM 9157 / 1139) TaxID=1236973 RepID=W4QNV2_HALA3|nr:M23 family metallopeptidase [Halalkalibacter akibai]GAE33790.1 hypothetical protein JCM9157_815 [Halalkalibacter akibai JCM 9157]
MKKYSILMGILLLAMFSIFYQQEASQKDQGQLTSMNEENSIILLPIKAIEKETHFLLDDFINLVGGTYDYNSVHRTLDLRVNGDTFYFVDGVPVVQKNGEYLVTDAVKMTINEQEHIYLPVSFIEVALGSPVTSQENTISFRHQEEAKQVASYVHSIDIENWDVEKMVEYLAFLEKPIKGAEVSKIPSHLPGAPRAYRNGFHEGIDWYDFASGGGISTNTPVYAMGEGVVVRADQQYEEYASSEDRNQDLTYTAAIGETPEFIFDRLRGRQVWVQYEGGVMNRFAHLHAIPENIQVGTKVDSETVIGYVGNSGTSDAVEQNYSAGLHLHQDLLIYGELFWKYLSQEEVLEVLERIWE